MILNKLMLNLPWAELSYIVSIDFVINPVLAQPRLRKSISSTTAEKTVNVWTNQS